MCENFAIIRNANSRNAQNIYFDGVKRISLAACNFVFYSIIPKHEFYIRVYTHNIQYVIENIVAGFEIDISAVSH
jgi:hypothetical protein